MIYFKRLIAAGMQLRKDQSFIHSLSGHSSGCFKDGKMHLLACKANAFRLSKQIM